MVSAAPVGWRHASRAALDVPLCGFSPDGFLFALKRVRRAMSEGQLDRLLDAGGGTPAPWVANGPGARATAGQPGPRDPESTARRC